MDITNLLIGGFGLVIGIIGSFFISLPGLKYSKKAFQEAREAKEAAEKAGNFVKLKTIASEILEISYLCRLEPDILLLEAKSRYRDINNKFRKIIGLLKESDFSNNETLTNARAILDTIKEKLSNIPIDEKSDNYVFFQLNDFFDTLSGLLSELNGELENKLINK